MDFKQLDRGEAIAVVGGVVLVISLFLPWFTLGDRYTVLSGCHGPNGSCTAWSALQIIRFLVLIAAVAPAILAWIIIRGHALSWPRGELTAVTAIAALTLIVVRAIIFKPGAPPSEIGIDWGWFIALAGGLLILVGSVARAKESGARRKPPGVL